jgi:polyisoprenoid-binding protein YceI
MKAKLLTLVIALALVPVLASATDTYVVDRTHSEVGFRAKHMVGYVPGKFTDYEGTVALDPANFENSFVDFTVKAASIDTGTPDRDKHLRSEDFFWVEKYPTLTFKSEKIRKTGKDQFDVTGTMTIRGVAKKITIPVEFNGFVKDPWGNEKIGFSSEFTVNRKDYGLVWNKTLDSGGIFLGDDVKITLNFELAKKK